MPTLYAKRKRYLSLEHFAITKGIGNREMAMFIGEGKGKKEKLFDETFVTVPLPDFPIMFFHESLKTSLEKGGKINTLANFRAHRSQPFPHLFVNFYRKCGEVTSS